MCLLELAMWQFRKIVQWDVRNVIKAGESDIKSENALSWKMLKGRGTVLLATTSIIDKSNLTIAITSNFW